MKHIDKIRSTNSFHVSATHIEHMAAIAARFGSDLISVAHDAKADKINEYTVRTSNRASGIFDQRVEVYGTDVRTIERDTIIDFVEFDRARARDTGLVLACASQH